MTFVFMLVSRKQFPNAKKKKDRTKEQQLCMEVNEYLNATYTKKDTSIVTKISNHSQAIRYNDLAINQSLLSASSCKLGTY